jgi:hypothetical protein
MTAAQQPIHGLVEMIRSPDYRRWYESLGFEERWRLGVAMVKLLAGLAEAERIALGARIDARATIAAASQQEGAELEEAAGLLEMDSLERVAAVLSVLEESGFGPRRETNR